MTSDELFLIMKKNVDDELKAVVEREFCDYPPNFRQLLSYQMMWDLEENVERKGGKKLRPLMLLLTCHALGGDWRNAVAAAASIELIHNFSLIHDDIQDRGLLRHGRDAVWVKFGEAQAINIGDAMLVLATVELLTLSNYFPSNVVLKAVDLLQQATFALTGGQYLDLAFENSDDIHLTEYWQMINGKTGALFAASFGLGALLAGQVEEKRLVFQDFGRKIGAAFQVQDDYLGIWGVDQTIGKSNDSDLSTRKKTYPVICALDNIPLFYSYWHSHDNFSTEDVEVLKEAMDTSGIKDLTREKSDEMYEMIFREFEYLFKKNNRSRHLNDLLRSLLQRQI